MQITQNCIVPGMPEKVYHSDPTPILDGFKESASLSSSTLSDIVETTEIQAKMRNERLSSGRPIEDEDEDGKKESTASKIGTIAHDFILRGEKGTYEVANFDAWRSDAAKAAKERIESKGLIALNTTTEKRIVPVVKAMKEALHKQLDEHRDYPGIMRIGKPELACFAYDGEIWNRALIDWKEESSGFEDLIVDYKTTGISFENWEKQCLWGPSAKYLQNKHYRRTLSILTGKEHRFIFVVQQVNAPHLIRIIEIDRSCYDDIDNRYNYGRKKFINCLKTGEWAGEIPKTFHSYPPNWVVQRWELDEMNRGVSDSETKKQMPTDVRMAG